MLHVDDRQPDVQEGKERSGWGKRIKAMRYLKMYLKEKLCFVSPLAKYVHGK
jgi:hypothetical protein